MNAEKIAELRALLGAATTGERRVVRNGLQQDCGTEPRHMHAGLHDADGVPCPDCRLEVAAVNNLRALLAENECQAAENERLRAAIMRTCQDEDCCCARVWEASGFENV